MDKALKPAGDHDAASPAELGAVALGLAAALGLMLSITGSWWLFTRFFWLDEIYTHTLVADPSPGHALAALAGGVETHPPALYLLLRPYTRLVRLAGFNDEAALRSFAVMTILLGLVGIYACLRRCFRPSGCLLAVLAAWCYPLVLEQAFNARFYGPWMAAAVWCAYFLVRTRVPGTVVARLMVAGCAVLVCTMHYFGVASLVLMVAGELLARWRAGLPLWPGLAATAAGPLALAACLPLLLGQSGALTETTWMPDVTLAGTLGLFRTFVEGYPFGWLALAAWLSVQGGRESFSPREKDSRPLFSLTALLGLPVIMVAFSWVVKPAYDSRYSFPAVAAVVAAAGWLGASCSRGLAIVLAIWLLILGVFGLDLHARQQERLWVSAPQHLIEELRQRTDHAPIIFELPWQFYVVYRYAPDLRPRCVLLDYETGEMPNRLPGEIFARDLARRYVAYYPEPRLIPWKAARRLRHFFLVSGEYGLKARPPVPGEPYPGFRIRPVGPGLLELTAGSETGE